MIYTLVIITAMATQPIGSYDNLAGCREAQADANKQGIKAICVQQESPSQIIMKMQLLMKDMQEQINGNNR